MGKVFNKGLEEDDDKKEGLLKTLKNIGKSQTSNNDNLSSFRSSRLSGKTLVYEDEVEDEDGNKTKIW